MQIGFKQKAAKVTKGGTGARLGLEEAGESEDRRDSGRRQIGFEQKSTKFVSGPLQGEDENGWRVLGVTDRPMREARSTYGLALSDAPREHKSKDTRARTHITLFTGSAPCPVLGLLVISLLTRAPSRVQKN